MMKGWINSKKSVAAEIQYMGEAGITEECKIAVIRLIQHDEHISRVRILSCDGSHCLLLTIGEFTVIAIKSGFGSGYYGEGSRGFAFVLENLQAYGADIEEYHVDEKIISRIDQSRLTNGDLAMIDVLQPVRPTRWYDYIYSQISNRSAELTLWQEYRPVIPWAIIDSRITDLALAFLKAPDDTLLKGYRRLEDIVRKRTKLNDYGASLFSDAFNKEKGVLIWKNLSPGEQQGRVNLFSGAYMAHRNPRAHCVLNNTVASQLTEFLILNHLYLLEKESIER